MPQKSDTLALVERARRYEHQALSGLCELYYKDVYSYIHYRISNVQDTEDLTAEITTLEEPTYEDSELGEVLDVGDEFGIEEEADEAVGFDLPYAEPVPMAVGQVSGPWVAILFVTVIVMVIGLLFAVENGVNPDFSTVWFHYKSIGNPDLYYLSNCSGFRFVFNWGDFGGKSGPK